MQNSKRPKAHSNNPNASEHGLRVNQSGAMIALPNVSKTKIDDLDLSSHGIGMGNNSHNVMNGLKMPQLVDKHASSPNAVGGLPNLAK